jgi:hypothetical protein
MVFAMDALSVEAAPAHLYEAEAAAYYRSWRLAVAVNRGLSVACAHAERPQYRPGRAEHEAHAQDVAEFARLARKCLEANPAWEPNGMFLRWLWGRGVQVAEVFELLETARKEAA